MDNISYLYVVFNEFHIPCYIIFDGDKPSESDFAKLNGKEETEEADELRKNIRNKSKRNKELLTFVGEEIEKEKEYFFPPTGVKNKYAIWEKDFEKTFHMPIDIYAELKGEATKLYGTTSKPLAGRYIASELVEKYPEKLSPYIPELIRQIKSCEWTSSCLVQSH